MRFGKNSAKTTFSVARPVENKLGRKRNEWAAPVLKARPAHPLEAHLGNFRRRPKRLLAVDEASSHRDGDGMGPVVGGKFGKDALHVPLDGGF
jgi:hypothetical protein